MIAFQAKRVAGLSIAVEMVPHEVEVDGDDWVARCGERWSRKSDGGVLPSHYRGEVCAACEAA